MVASRLNPSLNIKVIILKLTFNSKKNFLGKGLIMSIGLYEKQKTNGFWQIDKTLFYHFKCIHTVLILDELIFHKHKHVKEDSEDQFFYYKADYLEKKLLIGQHIRNKCIDKLIESGILERQKRGIPTLWYYKINSLKIDEIINKSQCTEVNTHEIESHEIPKSVLQKTEISSPENRYQFSREPASNTPENRPAILPLYKEKDINKKILNTIAQPGLSVFDFASLYNKYPRKEGKSRGLKICKIQIKSEAEYDDLSLAIDNYVEYCSKLKDSQYIKHFSTFMNEWRDWVVKISSPIAKNNKMTTKELAELFGVSEEEVLHGKNRGKNG